jgi:hypothetical protein
LVEIICLALKQKQGKPWIVCGGEVVGPFVGGVQLPVEQAVQKVSKSYLSRITTVPNQGNSRKNLVFFKKNRG